MNTIIVEAKGKKIVGQVAESNTVELATPETIDNTIATGMDEIVAMLGGDIQDPTQKRCSRCVKMGRVPYHAIEDFSLLKDGKRHSQCKVCRVEQARVYDQLHAARRKEYHRAYHLTRGRREPRTVNTVDTVEVPVGKVDATNALFVGFTSETN